MSAAPAKGIFNIAGRKRTSPKELASSIGKILEPDLQRGHRDPRPIDIGDSVADISRAREIGYKRRPPWRMEMQRRYGGSPDKLIAEMNTISSQRTRQGFYFKYALLRGSSMWLLGPRTLTIEPTKPQKGFFPKYKTPQLARISFS